MFFSHTLVFHKYPLCITYHIYFLLSIGFIFDLYCIDITEFLLYYVLVITDKERSHMANGYNPLNDWFYLNRQTRKKGDRQSNLHYHHSYEIFIILRGSTTLLADDKLISVSKNEIVLLKPVISTKTTAVRNTKDMLFILPNIIFHNICCLMHTKTCSICLTIRKYIWIPHNSVL